MLAFLALLGAPYIYDISSLRVNITLEKVIRDAAVNTRGTIFYKSVQILAYADYIDIIGKTQL